MDFLDQNPWHILYIDDDQEDFILTRDMLTQSGSRKIRIDWSPTYEEGKEKLALDGYDAVLVDYDLGSHTGIELIREYSQNYPAPMILYTGRGSREVDLEAMQAGASLYLTKNEVNALLLERGIRYAIEIKQKEHELRQSQERLEQELEFRKNAEEALKKSEEKFSKSFRSSPIAIAISTVAEGRFIEVNDRYCALYGFTRGELVGHTSREIGLFLNPEDRKEIVRRFNADGGFTNYEIQLRTKSGELKDVLFSTEGIELNGEQCMVSMVLDITERKRTEEALQKSEALMSQALSIDTVGVLFFNLEGEITGGNETFVRLSGYSREEIEKGLVRWDELTPPEFMSAILHAAEELRAAGKTTPYEKQLIRKDGSRWWGLFAAKRIDESNCVEFVQDITERKQAEQALREDEERLRNFMDSTQDVFFSLDHDWRFQYINRRFSEVLKVNPEDIIGKVFWEEYPDRLGTIVEEHYRKAMIERVPAHFQLAGFNTPAWYEISVYPTLDGIAVFIQDRTEEKRARDALAESEARFRDLANNISQLAWMTDETGWIFWYNERWFEYTGTTLEEMEGWGWQKVHHPEHVERVVEKVSHCFATGEIWEDTFPLRGKDGQYRWFLSRAIPIKDENGKVLRWFGTNTDITERMQMEERLRQNEAMLEAFFANSPGILNLEDEEFRYLKTDPITPTYFGLDRQSILGKAVKDLAPEFIENFGDMMKRVIQTGQPEQREVYSPVSGRAGEVATWQASYFPVPLPNGKTGIGIMGVEITEQKRNEQALRDSEQRERDIAERFQAILENSLDVAYRRDLLTDTYDYMSPVVEQVLGFTRDEMLQMGIEAILERIHPENLPAIVDGLERATELGKGKLQYRFRHKNGSYRWVADYITVTKDKDGKPIYQTGILRDITEAIQRSRALQESEEKLRLALDAAKMGTWVYEPQTDLINFGEHAQKLYNCGPGKISHTNFSAEHMHPEDLPRMLAALAAASDPSGDGHYQMVYRFRKDDHTWRWLNAFGQMEFEGQGVDRHPVRMVGASRDITEEKQAEEALRESEARFRVALASAPISIYTTDDDLRITWMYAPYPDFRIETITGQRLDALMPSDIGTQLIAIQQSVIDTGQAQKGEIMGWVDGKPAWYTYYIDPIFDDLGKITGLACAGYDITERKLAEEELKKSIASERARTAELETLMDTVPAMIWISRDPQCRTMTGNRFGYEALRMWQGANISKTAPEEDLAKQTFRSFRNGREIPIDELPMQMAARTGKPTINYDYDIVFADGSVLSVLGNVNPLFDENGKPAGVVAAFMDITDRRKIEEQMKRYAAELERSNQALQDFASIAGHDLQEPLRKVQAFGHMLQTRFARELEVEGVDYITRITSAANRMSTMLDGLLSYSRVTSQAKPFEPVDLAKIISEVLSDLDARILQTGGRVNVYDLPEIQADPLQMRQLFQNLLGNALKYHQPGVPPIVTVSSKTNEDQVEIMVNDNGIGFDMKDARRLFQPFSRLKGRSEYEGTGMGLAICKKIVERHNGSISVESAPGEGSNFKVILPVK